MALPVIAGSLLVGSWEVVVWWNRHGEAIKGTAAEPTWATLWTKLATGILGFAVIVFARYRVSTTIAKDQDEQDVATSSRGSRGSIAENCDLGEYRMDEQRIRELFIEIVQETGLNHSFFAAFRSHAPGMDWCIQIDDMKHQLRIETSIHRTDEQVKAEIKRQLLSL